MCDAVGVPDAPDHAAEVLAALEAVAREAGVTSEAGARIQADRGSARRHLGLRTPLRRRRVKRGFSFSGGSATEVLTAWDQVWRHAEVADVLFAPLDHYRDRPIGEPADFWPVVSRWIERVDNWAHADDLARVYSRVLEADAEAVYPTLLDWSHRDDLWHRRIAMVSLIRYSGKNVNFMPTDAVLTVVANCIDDHRSHVSKAAGWVLRETMKADEPAVRAFVDSHQAVMPLAARRRALENVDRA